jgi:CRP/FNR family transcriptional regulator, anaerobic regulatory protein
MTEKELGQHFPTLEKDLLSEIAMYADVKTVREGDTIMKTGQNIRAAILVAEGLVKIFRQDEEGDEYFMYYLDEGKACAISLVCALGMGTSGVMAKAVTNATILAVPAQYVDEWMGKYKSWAQFAVSSYRERFEELMQVIDHIAFRNMDERLVYYLKRYQEKFNSDTISTSFTEMAQELNSSREVISRLMKKLSEKGAVVLMGSHVKILDLDKAIS